MDDEAKRGRGEDAETEERERKAEGARKVPFFGMFRYASRSDLALMAVGTVAAMVNGMGDPLMTIVFSAVIDCFGAGDNVLQRVSKVVLYYICARGVMLDNGWRTAVNTHPISIPRSCSKAGCFIL